MRVSRVEAGEDIRSRALALTRDAALVHLTHRERDLSQRVHELSQRIAEIQQRRQEAEEERMAVNEQCSYQQGKMEALVRQTSAVVQHASASASAPCC